MADARRVPTPRAYEPACVLCSAQEAVALPVGVPRIAVIGERINPTGKPKLKAALRAGDLDYLVGEAVSQQELGADVLDVNVGLPELDEPAVLAAAVDKLSSTVTLPAGGGLVRPGGGGSGGARLRGQAAHQQRQRPNGKAWRPCFPS